MSVTLTLLLLFIRCRDAVIGLKGRDFVLLVADRSTGRSIITYKQDDDKIMQLDSHKAMAQSGPVGDRAHFGEYIQKNIALYNLRTGITLNTHATANWTRNQLAEALRQGPYQVNILLAGYDEKGPSLYYMDYLASLHKVNFGAHGYASNFVLSILDRNWHKDLTQDEAIDLIKKCMNELSQRFLLHMPNFLLKFITKDGIKEQELSL